MILKFSSN